MVPQYPAVHFSVSDQKNTNNIARTTSGTCHSAAALGGRWRREETADLNKGFTVAGASEPTRAYFLSLSAWCDNEVWFALWHSLWIAVHFNGRIRRLQVKKENTHLKKNTFDIAMCCNGCRWGIKPAQSDHLLHGSRRWILTRRPKKKRWPRRITSFKMLFYSFAWQS